MPGVVVHLHFAEDVTREKLALGDGFLATLHFNHFFDRHHDAAKFFLHAQTGNALLNGAHHTLFEAGVGMYDVPAFAHDFFQPSTQS